MVFCSKSLGKHSNVCSGLNNKVCCSADRVAVFCIELVVRTMKFSLVKLGKMANSRVERGDTRAMMHSNPVTREIDMQGLLDGDLIIVAVAKRYFNGFSARTCQMCRAIAPKVMFWQAS